MSSDSELYDRVQEIFLKVSHAFENADENNRYGYKQYLKEMLDDLEKFQNPLPNLDKIKSEIIKIIEGERESDEANECAAGPILAFLGVAILAYSAYTAGYGFQTKREFKQKVSVLANIYKGEFKYENEFHVQGEPVANEREEN